MGGRRMSSALLLPFALLSLPPTDAANTTTYRIASADMNLLKSLFASKTADVGNYIIHDVHTPISRVTDIDLSVSTLKWQLGRPHHSSNRIPVGKKSSRLATTVRTTQRSATFCQVKRLYKEARMEPPDVCATELRVVAFFEEDVVCPPISVTSSHIPHFTQGTRLGNSAHFSCQPGFQLNGSVMLTCKTNGSEIYPQEEVESSLRLVHAVATGATGALCVTHRYGRLRAPLHASRWDSARARADLAANILHQLGLETADYLMAVSQGLVLGSNPTERAVGARALALRTDGLVNSAVAWERYGTADPVAVISPQLEKPPDPEYPWYVSAHESEFLRSPKFMPSPAGVTMEGWWTYPYYSCEAKRWLLSYTVPVPTIRGLKGIVSLDIDISSLEINQCEANMEEENYYQIYSFHGTHKCPNETTYCEYKPNREMNVRHAGWARGSYICRCRPGHYSIHHPEGYNGSLVEVAYQEYEENGLENWSEPYECLQCQPGCESCKGPEPCLATYNWPFRISLLVISVSCAVMTVCLTIYTRHHRRVKVFRVASPVFLSITLLGCAIMYMEMAAIFPVLDRYSCIATKWTRHLGFCITYTALLMKTWRVSLTYRVKSAHKLKLTDKQLLQWMAPILLIMLVYLGTWTLSSPPDAEVITDNRGLKFKQCTYNWWDHSLAIGEILFLLWGVRVCYRVRHAESLYNEARLISIAIYNIFTVNSLMIAFHLLILPRAGPDIKYLLGFIRTQLSTSTTVLLVFLPKVLRVVRGTGDTWDSRARARGIPASSSLNGIGLVPDEPPDLYQENEELKEEVQKLAAQIEFMKIVQMEMHNRHLRPRPGGYFTTNANVAAQSPIHSKTVNISQDSTEWSGPV